MKRNIILFTILAFLLIGFAYLSHNSYGKTNIPENESDLSGKETNKEEYLYKEDLLTLGYTVNEIDTISKKISNIDVKNYLLNKKYNDLIKFIDSPYFHIINIERYQNYKDNNSTLNIDNIIMNTEIGIDNDFYTNINKTDTSLNELLIVNKYYNLDKSYSPTLVNVESGYGSGKAEKNTYDQFKKMVDAAKKDNIKLFSVSFYRSYDTQESVYNNYVKRDGVTKADTYSARPGHSEHQTGFAVDINTASSSANFQNTKEYEWLINNSYKYGFILRYPENKTHITGYKYEPWHYRYIGIDAATKVFEEQITYEEYFVKYLKYE